jgi:hypothetical protein
MDQLMKRLRGELARAQCRRARIAETRETLKSSIAPDVTAQVVIKAEVNEHVKGNVQELEESEELQQKEETSGAPSSQEDPVMFSLDEECLEEVDDLDWERGFSVIESASKTRDRSLSLKVHLMSSNVWHSHATDAVACKVNGCTKGLLSLPSTVSSEQGRSEDRPSKSWRSLFHFWAFF